MRHKMKKVWPSLVIGSIATYIFVCVWSLLLFSTEITILQISVYNNFTETAISSPEPNRTFNVHAGDAIQVTTRIIRTFSGSDFLERVLVAPDNTKKLLSQERVIFDGGIIAQRKVVYQIPHDAKPGCYYTIVTKNHYDISFNLITKITPIILYGSKVSFCVV